MFDLAALRSEVAARGRVARVVVAAVEGSAPREPGAAMLVWLSGQSGTIGGGALEWEAAERARALLSQGVARVDRLPLGPALGQCCGGAVTLVTEVYDATTVATLPAEVVARSPEGRAMPLAIMRVLDRARARGEVPPFLWQNGWLIEPVTRSRRHLWVWGAGHVGRAIVSVIAPLPEVAITWVDTARGRFPETVPEGVTCLWADDPALLIQQAPQQAEHLILTFSHALDLDLCHRLLQHGFRAAGLIGSETKWARFRSRLAGLGHQGPQIARIRCPIGDPSLGKHPQAIAVGVAAEWLRAPPVAALKEERA